MPNPASLVSLDPYQRANSMSELVSWPDVDFVRCAYVTILGRQPDADGEAFYTKLLRRGASKLDVLWQLRHSAEGRDHDPGIAGFDRALRRHRNANWPLLGAIIRAITGQEGNSPGERRFRALNNQLAVARLDQARELLVLRHHAEMQTAHLEKVVAETHVIADAVDQANSAIQLGTGARRSEHDDLSARLSGALAQLKVDLGSQYSALQLGIDLVRSEAASSDDLSSSIAHTVNQVKTAIELGIDARLSEHQNFSDRLSDVLAQSSADLGSQYSALQLGVDLVRSEAAANKDLSSLIVDTVNQVKTAIELGIDSRLSEHQNISDGLSEMLAQSTADLGNQYSALQASVDFVRTEAVRSQDFAFLKDASNSLLSLLYRILEFINADAARSDQLASMDQRAEARFASLAKAADEVTAQARSMENTQIEFRSALRARLDDALSLLRSAVRLEDVALVRDRLDALVLTQRDQVEFAKVMSHNTLDLLALARAGEAQSTAIQVHLDLAATAQNALNDLTTGLSVGLPEIRAAVEAVLSEHKEMTAQLTRVERHATHQMLVLKDQVLMTTDNGFVIIPDDDPVLLVMTRYMNGVLEPGTVAVIRHILDVGDVMIDVGAHIGLITLAASREVGETGRIFAIEPVSRSARALETMLHVNFLEERVQVNRCAAGRIRGKSQINVGRILGHSSLLPLEGSTESVMVDVKPIDDIVPKGTSVKLVKLDVEGFELECLEGMSRLLDENPNIGIVAEFGPSHLARAGLSISEWLNAFYNRGFEGWEIDEGKGQLSVPRSEKELAAVYSLNFLFWRGDKRRLRGLEKRND